MSQFLQLAGFRAGPDGPRVSGHRGARGVLPENTLEGFAFCQTIGVDSIEFDVVMTKDRVPVVVHNHTLDGSLARDASGLWLPDPGPRVAEMTLQDLRACDIGAANRATEYGRRYSDQARLPSARVPTLDEVLAFAAKSDLYLFVEMKTDPDAPDMEQERRDMAQAVVAAVRKAGVANRVAMHSFDWGILEVCRKIAPDLPTSYLSYVTKNPQEEAQSADRTVEPDLTQLTVSLPQAVADAGGQMWCPFFMEVTQEQVEEAHALGLLVNAWTVNSVRDINRMIDMGLDGIVTDFPGRVQDCLLRRNLK
ncbi:glycerophosphodiester phosphodiesterase [Shimia sp. R11_0]|uniref:glycerophosphodiester phosphodiesterase family protein n=1 Tax=Shimia sp. R11_0 TaxID=2821096 RepID=UPI001ADA6F66|nr:glycerophosphodiester phosphodiesterase family protein [Shimia sp. R11_0]MBO9478425.1 glycerophosphodiester phosphodiesterase [Shimia sp. R11_0]